MIARVAVHPLACRAFGFAPGTRLPAGAVVVSELCELVVMPDGTIEPRATPLPWSRPSIAAIPTAGRMAAAYDQAAAGYPARGSR